MKKGNRLFITAVLLILGSIGAFSLFRTTDKTPDLSSHFECILDIAALQDTTHALLTGYHYNLLKKFARDGGKTIGITLSNLDMNPLDSLLQGSADLIAMSAGETELIDSTICSIPIDSSVVWVMRCDREAEMVAINLWLDNHLHSPEDSTDRTRFYHPFGYHHSGYTGFISPYDSLIKVHADSIGWDWRMLASLIFIESRFHMEAKSYRGAEGLLQLMPSTAEALGSDDSFDPDESIRAGARYLKKLSRRYRKVVKDAGECFKYTAAAYNAGEGRIEDCIKYAEYRGKDPSLWSNIEQLIPEMRCDSVMTSDSVMASGAVKLGVFRGYETIAYVREAVNIYGRLCKLSPEKE